MALFTLLLGGNIGPVAHTFAQASELITERVGRITATSRDHVTEPWGFAARELFLNRALLVESTKAPAEVMGLLMGIEVELGRTRQPGAGHASRTIDIDILFIGDRVIGQPGLTVPHPRVHERTFALAPVADIAPCQMHPVLGKTVMDLLDQALR